MADNKILDSDSLVAVREFVNNKIDEKIAESGGSGSGYKEFLDLHGNEKPIFVSKASSEKLRCTKQLRNGRLSHETKNRYKGIRIGTTAFGTYSRNQYDTAEDSTIEITDDVNDAKNKNFIKNAVEHCFYMSDVTWMTPEECWNNYGRVFNEWGRLYEARRHSGAWGYSDSFNDILTDLRELPQGFFDSIAGMCFIVRIPDGDLEAFYKHGIEFGLNKDHKHNRFSIKFFKTNPDEKHIISKYHLLGNVRVICSDWQDDIDIGEGTDPDYIIGYVYPAVVRNFDFQDTYDLYINNDSQKHNNW